MTDEPKILHPEIIQESPWPGQVDTSLPITQTQSKDVISLTTTKTTSMPTKRVAVELLSSALNTRSKKVLGNFELVGSGGFQIGKYENGVSGDVRLTPNGITARNNIGDTTFALDGDTGDAIFKGTIQAGSVIASSILADFIQVGGAAGDINAGTTTIDGGKLTTGTVTADNVVASISITSPTITGGTIAIGSGDNILKADSNGIYLGNATFASAPFRVNMQGQAAATNINMAGGSIDAINKITFTTQSSELGDATCLYFYDNGSNYYFNTRMRSGNWHVTQSAF